MSGKVRVHERVVMTFDQRGSLSVLFFRLLALVPVLIVVACGGATPLPPTLAPDQWLTTSPASDLQRTSASTHAPLTTLKPDPTPDTENPVKAAPVTAVDFDCVNVDQIPLVECEALVALYNSTQGPGWADKGGWLTTPMPCTWYGIECVNGHVGGIDLGYNQLTGILPPELGDLSHLRTLSLSDNRLHGTIPAEVGHLSALVSLEMGANRLEGPLPAELGDLPNLWDLSLSNNQLSGSIPPALGRITPMVTLNLSHNRLSGAIPAELGNLVHLDTLYLSHNQLSGPIPAALGRLSHLSELDLSYNRLRGSVPGAVAQISRRSLWGNQLSGTIPSNGQAPVDVDYRGIHFTADPSLAISIWPEAIPARPALEGEPFWIASPGHVSFTFADPRLSLSRRRMGFHLAAEGQILVYPLAELAGLDSQVQARIETLQSLLAQPGPVPEGELPLLPITNAAQVFHAKAQYLQFGGIQGLRFISQHSQDPHPIMLSQELFYTFQGFTEDGAYYVAAFFPVTAAALPDAIEIDDWEAFHANYDAYLSETTAIVEQLPPAEFKPDLTLLDAVVTSLRLESKGVGQGGANP